MTTIRFTSLGGDANVTVDVGEGERRTLLSIAKEHGIPLPFRCEAGDCSTCVVHVDTVRVGRRPVARSTDKENTLLRAMYLLNQHSIEDAERRGISPALRLACHYEVRDEDIVVFFERPAGRV
jgi:ferredoxin